MHTQLGSNAQGPKIPLPLTTADQIHTASSGAACRALATFSYPSINGDLIPC